MGVHVSYVAINVSLYAWVLCPTVCIRDWFVTVWRLVCFLPLVLEYHYFTVMNIYQVGFMGFKCCRESSAGDLFYPNPILSELLPGAWENKLWERM